MKEKMLSLRSICLEMVGDDRTYYDDRLDYFKEILDGFGVEKYLFNGKAGGRYKFPESQKEYLKELMDEATGYNSYRLIREKKYYEIKIDVLDKIIGKFVQFLKATLSPSKYEETIIRIYEKTQYSFIKQLKLTEAKMSLEVQKNLIDTFKDSKISKINGFEEPMVAVLSTDDIACLVEHYRYLVEKANSDWLRVLNNFKEFRDLEDSIDKPDIKEPYQKVLEDSIKKAVDINELTIIYDDLAKI